MCLSLWSAPILLELLQHIEHLHFTELPLAAANKALLVAVPDGTCPYDTVRLLGMSVSIFMCVCVCVCITFNQWKFTFSQCVLHFSGFFADFTSFGSVRFDSDWGLGLASEVRGNIFFLLCVNMFVVFIFLFCCFWGQCGSAWKTILLFSNAFCCCSATAAAEVDCVIVGWAGRGQQDCRGGGGGGGGGKWKIAKVKNAYAPTCHTHTRTHTRTHTVTQLQTQTRSKPRDATCHKKNNTNCECECECECESEKKSSKNIKMAKMHCNGKWLARNYKERSASVEIGESFG